MYSRYRRAERLHAGLGADVLLAVRQAEAPLEQEGDVVFSPWMLGSTDSPSRLDD